MAQMIPVKNKPHTRVDAYLDAIRHHGLDPDECPIFIWCGRCDVGNEDTDSDWKAYEDEHLPIWIAEKKLHRKKALKRQRQRKRKRLEWDLQEKEMACIPDNGEQMTAELDSALLHIAATECRGSSLWIQCIYMGHLCRTRFPVLGSI